MKSLKEYINESIVTDDAVDEETLKKYNLVYNDRTDCYDCKGDVEVNKDLVTPHGTFKIKFGVIKGSFDCSRNKLTSLEGAPTEVGKDFYCNNNNLTSIIDAPQKVGRGFYCYDNHITSLEGAPTEVVADFNCSENNLTSLEGAPTEVYGSFYCSDNNLTSLKGAPKYVDGNFSCYNNPLIYSKKNFYSCLPAVIGGKLVADDDCDYEFAKEYYDTK